MPSLCSLARQCPPAVRCPCVFVVPASSLSPRRRCPHVIVVRRHRYSCIVVVPVSLLSPRHRCPWVVIVHTSLLSGVVVVPASSLSPFVPWCSLSLRWRSLLVGDAICHQRLHL